MNNLRTDHSDRSDSLDAIRGLAISLVIARHYFGFKQGMLGVDLFFVLSGFLIGGILLDSRNQPGYFTSFYGRRAFRILPLYWLALVIATPKHWQYYLFFAQAIPWLQFGFPTDEPLLVTWTLAAEEQFYLVLPVLIWCLPQRWLVRVLWTGVLLAPVWRWWAHAYLPTLCWEWLLPGRLDELFGGALLACFVRGYCRSVAAWIALACIPPLCDLGYAVAFTPFCFLSVAAATCAAIVWASTKVARPVLLRPLIWPGRRCYALYLFHWPFYVDTGLGQIPSGLASIAVVCAFAELSWRLIEAPLIAYAKRRFPRAGAEDVSSAFPVANPVGRP
ncbi:acyltransferase family protein [Bradyrhizobium mercantei]|uniref:acyltransferase family protein n=1 Tax=Bradyrhizobium mercantei TaxID=1904807 RepID=UPI0009762A7A|nr:acyltransferase [Bradyrhizobium mercantei]